MNLPNKLTILRIILVPFCMFFISFNFCQSNEMLHLIFAIVALVLFSVTSLTDMLDGKIARKYNLVTDFGKFLDPVADKLTQLATLVCLATRFSLMKLLFAALALKELTLGILGLVVVKKTKDVRGANWHGKLTTCLLYLTMALHIFWTDIPSSVSAALVGASLAVMLLSFVLYFRRHLRQLSENRSAEQ